MRILSLIENTISGILFIIGITVSLYGVFMRYVMNNSQSWATEIFTMLLVWAIFIGFSTALRDDKHIAIDILYDRVGPKFQRIFEVFIFIFGIAFSLFFLWTGIQLVIEVYQQEIVSIDVGFPFWINYMIMPIAGTLLLIRFIERFYKKMKNPEIKISEEEGETEWRQ